VTRAQREEVQNAFTRLEQLAGRLAVSEVHGSEVEDLRRVQATLQAHDSSMRDRVSILERSVMSLTEKADALKDVQAKAKKWQEDAHTKSQQQLTERLASELSAGFAPLQGRLVSCEEELAKSLAQLRTEVVSARDLAAQNATRLEALESNVAGACAAHVKATEDNHAVRSEFESLQVAVANYAARHEKQLATLSDAQARVRGDAEVTCLNTMRDLEGRVASCETQATELIALKEACAACAARQTAVTQRLELSEHELGELRCGQGTAAQALVSVVHTQLAPLVDKLGSLEANISCNFGKVAAETEALHTRHAALTRRVELAEGGLQGLVTSKPAPREHLEMLHSRTETLESTLRDLVGKSALQADALAESTSKTAQELEVIKAFQERWAAAEAALMALGTSVGRQAAELEVHGRRAQSAEAAAAGLAAGHTALADRLGQAEKLIRESADKCANELSEATVQISQLEGRVVQCEEHGPALVNLKLAQAAIAGESEAFRTQHGRFGERLESLERQVGDAGSAHVRLGHELEGLRVEAAQHIVAMERLGMLERGLNEGTGRQAEAMAGVLARLDALSDRLLTCEGDVDAVAELRGAQVAFAPMAGRLEHLEQELQELKSGQQERYGLKGQMERLEHELQELKSAQQELAKMRGVLSTVRRAWDQEPLQRSSSASALAGGATAVS